MINALHLDIIELSCTCGNRWTHSTSWLTGSDGTLGGTPSPLQEDKLQYASLSREMRAVSGCWRCVPLALSEGWTKPLTTAFEYKPSAAKKNTERDIEKELLK